eukprot:jgi/Mesvir1/23793/Mv10608-RA.3
MADAERDLPGSTFDWQVYQQQQYSLVGEYKKFVRSHRYYGAITLDTLLVDLSAELAAAVQSIPASGRPLYLAYGKAAPRDMRAFLGRFGAHNFVGVNPFDCGREVSQFGVSTGSHHVLANNAIPFLPWTWELMRGIVSGVVGDDYAFPPGVWDWPITRQGDPNRRRGAWSLWVARDSNNTAEIMNGMLPVVGEAFIPPLAQRLSTDVPAPDLLVLEAYHDLISSATMAMLADLAAQNPVGPPIQLATHKCTATDMLALARQGAVKGEELLLGCMDEQPYMSTYLSATLAALEQQTGERVVGGVDTARLIKASQLPPHFMRRVSCEMDNLIRGIMQGRLGVYFPVCHARRGCVDSGLNASRGAVVCSGRGSCRFPTHPNPSGETDPTQGTCRCNIGWNGTYCQHSTAPVLTDPPHPHDEGPPVLLIALLFGGAVLGLATAVAAALLFHARRTRGSARELQKLLHKRVPPRGGECIAVVVTDIESSTLQWEWNADAMNAALAIHHKVCDRLPHLHIMQVLPLELARRAPFRPLTTKQFSPSFFEAPCATECYLTGKPPREPVVICFMYVGRGKELSKVPGYQQAIELLVWFVQSRLSRYDAYECEEKDGMFMLAFRSAVKAACFAEAIQQEAMALPWPPHLLEQEAAAEVVKLASNADGTPRLDRVVFRGLRLQIGLCMGIPNDCRPHVATGRAAYFGQVVNRAARIAATAAPGQTLANQEVAESAKQRSECSGMTFQELGDFGLKGVRAPLRLFEISGPNLSLRLFPRTLKLARTQSLPLRYEQTGRDIGQQEDSQPLSCPPMPGDITMLESADRSPEGSKRRASTPLVEGSAKRKQKASCLGRSPRLMQPEEEASLYDMTSNELVQYVKYLLVEIRMLRGTPNCSSV